MQSFLFKHHENCWMNREEIMYEQKSPLSDFLDHQMLLKQEVLEPQPHFLLALSKDPQQKPETLIMSTYNLNNSNIRKAQEN